MPKRTTAIISKSADKKEELRKVFSFQSEIEKLTGNVPSKLVEDLIKMTGDKSLDDNVRLKAIELAMGYMFGKPKDVDQEISPAKFIIEHNIISLENVKKLKQ